MDILSGSAIESQARQVFVESRNVLKDAGSDSWVVKMTTFLVGRHTLPAYRRARDECLGSPIPANTLWFLSKDWHT